MVAGTQVVRLANGGAVQVKTGILRGIGPQGPMGPVGPVGPVGLVGPQGVPGQVNDLQTFLTNDSAVATGGGSWSDVALLQPSGGRNDLLVATTDGFSIQFNQSGSFIGVLVVRFEPTSESGGVDTSAASRSARICDSAGNQLDDAFVVAAAATSTPTLLILPFVTHPDPSKSYKLQCSSDDTAGVNVTYRSLTLVRIGAGPAGPPGPAGPLGTTGAQGIEGPVGSAGTGYVHFDDVVGGADSTASPGGAGLATTDQGLHVPGGSQLPSVPYFLARLATDLEPLLMARYADAATRAAKRPTRSPGELTVLADSGTPYFREKNGADNTLARVVISSAAPPTGPGQAAPGVIWIQT